MKENQNNMGRREFVKWAIQTTAKVGVVPGTVATIDFVQRNAAIRKETAFPACSVEVCRNEHVIAETNIAAKTLQDKNVQLDIAVVTALAVVSSAALALDDER